jgi:hypothetical protein
MIYYVAINLNEFRSKRAAGLYEHPKIIYDQQLDIIITPPQLARKAL